VFLDILSLILVHSMLDYIMPLYSATANLILALPNSLFHLAQCIGPETVEPFGVVARFSVANACCESEYTFDKVHNLVKTPLEGLCDEFVHKDFHSLGFDGSVLTNSLHHSYVSPLCSLPSHSLVNSIDVPIDNSMICDATMDLGY